MSSRIEDLCHTLRLSGIASCARELESSTFRDEIESFLISALEGEYDVRMARRRLNAIRIAGFPTMKRFYDLDIEALPDEGRMNLGMLKELKFRDHRNVLLIGIRNRKTPSRYCSWIMHVNIIQGDVQNDCRFG